MTEKKAGSAYPRSAPARIKKQDHYIEDGVATKQHAGHVKVRRKSKASKRTAEQMVSSQALKQLLALESYQERLSLEFQRARDQASTKLERIRLLERRLQDAQALSDQTVQQSAERESAMQEDIARLNVEIGNLRYAVSQAEAHAELLSRAREEFTSAALSHAVAEHEAHIAQERASTAAKLGQAQEELSRTLQRAEKAEAALAMLNRNYVTALLELDIQKERFEFAIARNSKIQVLLGEANANLFAKNASLMDAQADLSRNRQKLAQAEEGLTEVQSKYDLAQASVEALEKDLGLRERSQRALELKLETQATLSAELAKNWGEQVAALSRELQETSEKHMAGKSELEFVRASCSDALRLCDAFAEEIMRATLLSKPPRGVTLKLTDANARGLVSSALAMLGNRQMRMRRKLVAESGLFDQDWYLAQYPDVSASKMDALTHFVEFGSFEHRSPGPLFDSEAYLNGNLDVKQARVEPLFHYLVYGRREKRLAWRFSPNLKRFRKS